MIIRFAEDNDNLWLKENDQHISDEILKIKITSKKNICCYRK